jgi:hypothetical protein
MLIDLAHRVHRRQAYCHWGHCGCYSVVPVDLVVKQDMRDMWTPVQLRPLPLPLPPLPPLPPLLLPLLPPSWMVHCQSCSSYDVLSDHVHCRKKDNS